MHKPARRYHLGQNSDPSPTKTGALFKELYVKELYVSASPYSTALFYPYSVFLVLQEGSFACLGLGRFVQVDSYYQRTRRFRSASDKVL